MMEPKITTREAFKVVGLECITTMEENEKDGVCGKLWEKYNARCNEVTNKHEAGEWIGLCGPMETEGKFHYLAGVRVKDNSVIPEGMIIRDVAEAKVAIFKHTGVISKLGETYNYIYKEWLPKSGYAYNETSYDYELYNSEFTGTDKEDSVLYIVIPIK